MVMNVIIHISGRFHLSQTLSFSWYQAVRTIKETLYLARMHVCKNWCEYVFNSMGGTT